MKKLKADLNNSEKDGSWSVISLAWELGYLIAIPIVLLALGGRFLDKKFNSSPWFLLLGIFSSIVITTYLVYRKTAKIIEDEGNGEEGG